MQLMDILWVCKINTQGAAVVVFDREEIGGSFLQQVQDTGSEILCKRDLAIRVVSLVNNPEVQPEQLQSLG